jgi:hypothetical protein
MPVPREPKGPPITTPRRAPEVTPPYSQAGDLSFVEVVMSMQATLGGLREAVDTLKEQSRQHGERLAKIERDIHTVKIAAWIIGGIVAAVGSFLGIILKALLDYLLRSAPK